MTSVDKITPDDLLNAMADADVLEAFVHLPRSSQDKFHAWIGRARDDKSHWRRIEILVLAIKSAPLPDLYGEHHRSTSTEASED